MNRSARPLIALAVPAALLSAASPAGALGLPETFPRTIVITGVEQQVRVSRFDIATRPVPHARMRVTVNVAASGIGEARPLLIGVAPCRGGSLKSPSCPPAATTKIVAGTAAADPADPVTRTFTVRRPDRPDALRVTLTVATRASQIPSRTSNVAGGGGTGEILLNGGTWRFRPGTRWGMTAAPVPGFRVDRVFFNSRRYEWSGVSDLGADVTTAFGYTGETPARTFTNAMRPATTFTFYRSPSTPAQAPRTAPRAFSYRAAVSAGTLFAVSLPLPAYAGR